MDIRIYLELEQRLISGLRANLRPFIDKSKLGVANALAKGDTGLAFKLAKDIHLEQFTKESKQLVRFMLAGFATWGASQASKDGALLMQHHPDLAKTLDRTTSVFCANLAASLPATMIDSLTGLVTKVTQPQVTKAEGSPLKRYLKELVSFDEDADAMLKLISGLHSSRLSVWGFTAEADIRGVREYKLAAVLDVKTSEFCKLINGKTFKVEDARKSIITILNADDPEYLRVLQPWPKQTKEALEEFRTLTAEELTARGLHIPPFHPGCRTVLVTVDFAQKLRTGKPATAVESVLPSYVSNQEDFKAFGVKLTQEELEHWNRFLRVNPISLLSKLSNSSGASILDGVGDRAYAPISITHDGDFRLRFKLPAYSRASVSTMYEPLSGRFYIEYIKFADKYSPVQAAKAIRQTFANLQEAGAAIGAAEILVNVPAGLALPMAQQGIVPIAEAWPSVVSDIKNTLAGELSEGFSLLPIEKQNAIQSLLKVNDPRVLRILANMELGAGFMSALFSKITYTGNLEGFLL